MERKDAIDVVKKNWPNSSRTMLREALGTLIPELRESEDENTRRCISDVVRKYGAEFATGAITKEKMLAWLERQGENIPSEETILNVWDLGNIWKEITNGASNTEHGTQLDYIIRHWKERNLLTMRKADEAGPKFKVGDWIVANDGIVTNNGTNAFLITDIDCGHQSLGDVGIISIYCALKDTEGVVHYPCLLSENFFHPWSVEDAEDGDVLVDEDNNIGICKERDNFNWSSYIYLGCDNRLRGFSIGGYHNCKNTKPATKEQRELLFSKMREAKYEWDAGNKSFRQLL